MARGRLTCINFATVSGLLLGMAAGGLSRNVAWGAICLGIAAGLLALVSILLPPQKRNQKAPQQVSKSVALVYGCLFRDLRFSMFLLAGLCRW